MSETPTCSVVVACHNEADNIPELLARLHAVFDRIQMACEVVLIDDGSTDATLAVARRAAAEHPELVVVELSRNFGHQAAVTAGFELARGKAIILMDADLQDPPEVIPEMIAKWREGFDVAYGQRVRREGETWFKRTSAAAFYRMFRAISKMNLPVDTGEFRLMDRRVVDALMQMNERQRFLRGMVTWIGYRQTIVPYARDARKAGETHYPLRAMVRLAWDAFASFTNFPIKCLYYTGSFLTLMGVGVLCFSLSHLSARGVWGLFLSIVASGAVLTGCLLCGMGVLGEYISRIYEEVKRRPLYLVRAVYRGASRSEHGRPLL